MHTTNSPLRSMLRTTLALVLPLGAACAADSATDGAYEANAPAVAPADVGEKLQSVIGGTLATDCQWPSTVRVDPAQCTGTLIHPRVVTTAAHCMTGTTASIGFGNRGAPGGFSVQARCVAGARGSSGGGTGRDWAYCILPEDPRIAKIPVTPPLVGCEAELIKPGAMGWVVGFGSTSPRGPVGPKRQVEVKINRYDKLAPGTIDIGDRESGACHGDSGGPLYVKLTKDGVDYGYRTLGSTSGAGGNCDCTCSTTYVNIFNHVKAIEKNEGIDVTPCTDADGKWDPSPACTAFESAPAMGAGTFPECTAMRTSLPIATCGAATTAVGDGGVGPSTGVGGDAGADAGARADASTPSDAGARTDGGARADAGSQGDAARPRDAGARDAGRKKDAAPPPEEEEEDDGRADSADEDEESGDKPAYKADSGCSTGSPPVGGLGTLSLVLVALALMRARRPSPRTVHTR